MNNDDRKTVVYTYDDPMIREESRQKALEIMHRESAENIIEARSMTSGKQFKIHNHICTIALVQYSPND